MRSVSGKYWEEINIDKRLIDKIRVDTNLSQIAAKLIVLRKFDQLEIDSINKKIELINPFLRNHDFELGYEILDKILKQDKNILIIGDYDVDGCISTSLFVSFFKLLNKNCDFLIPNRIKDGYGVSLNLINKLENKKIDLIIMVDCGSNSQEAINYLNKKKIKTIIIDHHNISKPYPNSNCLINPKKECTYNHLQYLCSSSITYFFIDFFIKKKKVEFKL